MTGYLYWDDSIEGRRPGVLVVHEWWGLNDYAKKRASMLAEMGYAAFAVDMYGGDKVTTDPDAGSFGIENLKYDQAADEASWKSMQAFLEVIF